MDEDDIATKIQSGYKGMVAREEFKDLKNTKYAIQIIDQVLK